MQRPPPPPIQMYSMADDRDGIKPTFMWTLEA